MALRSLLGKLGGRGGEGLSLSSNGKPPLAVPHLVDEGETSQAEPGTFYVVEAAGVSWAVGLVWAAEVLSGVALENARSLLLGEAERREKAKEDGILGAPAEPDFLPLGGRGDIGDLPLEDPEGEEAEGAEREAGIDDLVLVRAVELEDGEDEDPDRPDQPRAMSEREQFALGGSALAHAKGMPSLAGKVAGRIGGRFSALFALDMAPGAPEDSPKRVFWHVAGPGGGAVLATSDNCRVDPASLLGEMSLAADGGKDVRLIAPKELGVEGAEEISLESLLVGRSGPLLQELQREGPKLRDLRKVPKKVWLGIGLALALIAAGWGALHWDSTRKAAQAAGDRAARAAGEARIAALRAEQGDLLSLRIPSWRLEGGETFDAPAGEALAACADRIREIAVRSAGAFRSFDSVVCGPSGIETRTLSLGGVQDLRTKSLPGIGEGSGALPPLEPDAGPRRAMAELPVDEEGMVAEASLERLREILRGGGPLALEGFLLGLPGTEWSPGEVMGASAKGEDGRVFLWGSLDFSVRLREFPPDLEGLLAAVRGLPHLRIVEVGWARGEGAASLDWLVRGRFVFEGSELEERVARRRVVEARLEELGAAEP